MTEPVGITYQATLRRSEMVAPALAGLVAALVVGGLLAKRQAKGDDVMIAVQSSS